MARSAGDNPLSDASHSNLLAVDKETWKTGQSGVSSGEVFVGPPRAEKAVALIIVDIGNLIRADSSYFTTFLSFNEVTNTPKQLKPFIRIDLISWLTGAKSEAVR